MAGFFSLANARKTWYYLQKNGIKSACLAVWERLEERKQPPYQYTAPSYAVLEAQRIQAKKEGAAKPVCFSVLVPAYETKREYLTALLDSVRAQSWPYWELVIADAGHTGQVYETLTEWCRQHCVLLQEENSPTESVFRAGQIRYVKLKQNGGISENTNAALAYAFGEYTGLLDHDDLLTPDALFEMAAAIQENNRHKARAEIFYSDEDKCDGSGRLFYEPHYKTDFDPELLLTNNYICHFMVMKTECLQSLKLRRAYDGAQDFDLMLRALAKGCAFAHVPHVLYHWRCHTDSTAANPQSKRYAYEAGKRAVADFCQNKGWHVTVSDTRHLGFYRVDYEDLWRDRPEIGAVAYPVSKKGRLLSGIYEKDGSQRFEGLRSGFSGYIHRAVLQQQAHTADVRQLRVRPQLEEEKQRAIKRCRETRPQTAAAEFAGLLESKGMGILWDPKGR